MEDLEQRENKSFSYIFIFLIMHITSFSRLFYRVIKNNL